MTWGKRVPHPERLVSTAPSHSPEGIVYRLTKFYPGSWLPAGRQQVIDAASPRFKIISARNGRLDYIETLNRWGASTRRLFRLGNIFPSTARALSLVPRYLRDPDFRVQISSLCHKDQQECFKQEIMSHERMFFEKK